MSLRQELAVDRRYVATRYEEPQGYQTLQDAAEDIIPECVSDSGPAENVGAFCE